MYSELWRAILFIPYHNDVTISAGLYFFTRQFASRMMIIACITTNNRRFRGGVCASTGGKTSGNTLFKFATLPKTIELGSPIPLSEYCSLRHEWKGKCFCSCNWIAATMHGAEMIPWPNVIGFGICNLISLAQFSRKIIIQPSEWWWERHWKRGIGLWGLWCEDWGSWGSRGSRIGDHREIDGGAETSSSAIEGNTEEVQNWIVEEWNLRQEARGDITMISADTGTIHFGDSVLLRGRKIPSPRWDYLDCVHDTSNCDLLPRGGEYWSGSEKIASGVDINTDCRRPFILRQIFIGCNN